MFFFEWVVPVLAVIVIGTVLFYLAVRNRSGFGVRTEGKTFVDKPTEAEEAQKSDRDAGA